MVSTTADKRQPRVFADPPMLCCHLNVSADGHTSRLLAGSDDRTQQKHNPLRLGPVPRKGQKCALAASTLPVSPNSEGWGGQGQTQATLGTGGKAGQTPPQAPLPSLGAGAAPSIKVHIRNLEPDHICFPPRKACDCSASSRAFWWPLLSQAPRSLHVPQDHPAWPGQRWTRGAQWAIAHQTEMPAKPLTTPERGTWVVELE